MRIDLNAIAFGTITDQGQVREENQDAIGYFETSDKSWKFLLVCDGMGGHAGGRTASTLAVEEISLGLLEEMSLEQSPEEAIASAIRRANGKVFERAQAEPELRGMGTTCALIAIREDGSCWLAHVGDSRIFYILPGMIEQKTRDHTTVQRLVDGGLIEAKDAESHPDAGLLSRCVGVKPQVDPEVQGPIELREGDRFLACSDGLTNEVDPKEIGAMLLAFEPPDALKRLVMLANERGGKDNISIVSCHVLGKHAPTGSFKPKDMKSVTPEVLTPTLLPVLSPPAPPVMLPEVSARVLELNPPPLVFANDKKPQVAAERMWTKKHLMVLVPLVLAALIIGLVVGGYLCSDSSCASSEKDWKVKPQVEFQDTGKNNERNINATRKDPLKKGGAAFPEADMVDDADDEHNDAMTEPPAVDKPADMPKPAAMKTERKVGNTPVTNMAATDMVAPTNSLPPVTVKPPLPKTMN